MNHPSIICLLFCVIGLLTVNIYGQTMNFVQSIGAGTTSLGLLTNNVFNVKYSPDGSYLAYSSK